MAWSLIPVAEPSPPGGVAVVFAGGFETSQRPARGFGPAVLRMRPIAAAITRDNPQLAVYRMIYGLRGWNGTGASALSDARQALNLLRERFPGGRIVLVGHSMGGRVALRLGSSAGVAGVVALAPWTPPGEPVAHLSQTAVRVIQGTRDCETPLQESDAYLCSAVVADVPLVRTVLPGAGHMMIRQAGTWHRLAAGAVGELVSV